MRDSLIHDQIVVLDSERYVFGKDYVFSSPIRAAGVVLGRSANGWTEWKNKEGKTLDADKDRAKTNNTFIRKYPL